MKLQITKWTEKAGNELTANGLVRINPNKPTFGSIMLIATVASLSNGFMNVKNKVGFVVGEVKTLETLISGFNLKDGDDYSAKVGPHRIVTTELLESQVPERQGYRPKINPSTNEILSKDGEAIYWKTEVVAEGSDIQDSFISHDKEPAIDTAVSEFEKAGSQKA